MEIDPNLINLLKTRGYKGNTSIFDILDWFAKFNHYIYIRPEITENGIKYVGVDCYYPYTCNFETNPYSSRIDALESLLFDVQNLIYDI